MADVSLPVGPVELREQVGRFGPAAYLVTVALDTKRPHVVSVTVHWEGDALVCGAGSRTAANIGDGADVTLVWPPAAGDAYSLIVDGPAEIASGSLVSVRPAGSVLHRVAGATGAAADGPGCIPVTTMLATAQEVPVGDTHPNAAAVRRFLDAWLAGDLPRWTALAAADIVIHMRGKPALNGRYVGAAGVTELSGKFAGLGVDGFEMEVDDIVADDRYAMAVVRSTYRRGDERLDLRTACACRIGADGRIAEVWGVSDNQVAESNFFTLTDVGAAGLGVGLAPPS